MLQNSVLISNSCPFLDYITHVGLPVLAGEPNLACTGRMLRGSWRAAGAAERPLIQPPVPGLVRQHAAPGAAGAHAGQLQPDRAAERHCEWCRESDCGGHTSLCMHVPSWGHSRWLADVLRQVP